MHVETGGAKRTLATVAVVVVTALTVTSVIAMPALAAQPAPTSQPTATGAENPAVTDPSASAALGQTLRSKLAAADANDTVRALILLDDQPDVEAIRDRVGSREELVERLEQRVRASQAPVLESIEAQRASGDVTAVDRHWLVNAVSIEATPGAIRGIRGAQGVAAVLADIQMQSSSGAPGRTQHNDTGRTGEPNVTVTSRDRIDRSASTPRALQARDEVSLPDSYAVPEWPGELNVEGANAPEPITGPPSGDVPDAASTPFDDDGVAWGVERVRADGATRAGFDGSNVTVAVIDTGIDDGHPDLDDRVAGWTDLVNGFDNPYDDGGHGTHVAGTIAGTGDGGLRTGVAPGADLLGVKVLDGRGSGLLSDVIAGMEWSIRNDADVMSLSLGGPHDPVFHAAMDRAVDAGVVPVVAAGNIGGSRDPFSVDLSNLLAVTDPGHARSAVTVGATHWQDRVAWFSARETFTGDGERYRKPDVTAPGANVTSAEAGTNQYVSFSGTSMAAPHVSGIAALILQADPSANPDDVKRFLEASAQDVGEPGSDDVYGAGRVDASAALAAAGSTPELDLDVEANDAGEATAVASLTDGSGSPLPDENVSLNVVYGPPSTLETHKANAELYALSETRRTDENGTVTFSFDTGENSQHAGAFTVEATAREGLVRNVSSIGSNDDLSVTVSSPNDSVRYNGDALVFDLEARDGAGEPANVTVDAVLSGPTNDRLPDWNRSVTTGDDGTATVTVRLHEDPIAIYQGRDPSGGGPSFGGYGLTTVVRDEDGAIRAFDVHRDVVDVEPRWTDLEFGESETPLTSIADVETWQGELTVGDRVRSTLETTEPDTEYRIVLANFDSNASRTNGSALGSTTTVANVTTDGDGSAAFDARIPGSLPGGYYAVLAVREGRNLTDPGPIGSFDVGYVHVRAVETSINVESREDAHNQVFQPGEAVHVTVETSNASTGAPTDLRDFHLQFAGFTDISAVERTAPGTIEMNARFADRGTPEGVIRLVGTDQNGGRIANHTERMVARPFTVQVTPDARRYEPGRNATLDVRVADSESGEPVPGAEARAIVTGATATGSWSVNRTVQTDEDGSATITVPIPSDAVGIDYVASDALVLVTSIEKGSDASRATTGFDLIERDGPSISVGQNGSEQVGLFGLNDVALYEPGERIRFDVETSGVDPDLLGDRSRYVDVMAVKYSKIGDGAYVFDAAESESAIVPLEDGRATYEYSLSDDAEPGLVVPIVSTRLNGVALSDSQLGIVGASPMRVSTNRSTVAQGERIHFRVAGDVPRRADVDFVVKRKGSQGQVPIAALDEAAVPDLTPIRAERNRSLARSAPLAGDVVDRLPETVGNRDGIRRALQEALVPVMSGSLSGSTTDAAIGISSEQATPDGVGGHDAGQTFVVPENLAPGTYRVIAIAHSNDGSVKERIGFAEFEVEE